MKSKIIKKIKEIEKEKGVRIVMAIESGSREWGFSSNDSDYDVRCIHVFPEEKYLGIEPFEQQIDFIRGDIDLVSWDIHKFFELFMKSNPTVSEWLSSKEIYINGKFGEKSKENLCKIFEEGFSRNKIKNHYLSLAKQNYHKYINIEGDVSLKKYVYILRALGCIEYITKTNSLPPLNWKLSSKYLEKEIQDRFAKLVELKKTTETKKDKRDSVLDSFIECKLRENFDIDKSNFDKNQINEIVITAIKEKS